MKTKRRTLLNITRLDERINPTVDAYWTGTQGQDMSDPQNWTSF